MQSRAFARFVVLPSARGCGFLLGMWASLKNYSDGALLFLRLTLGPLGIYLYGWPALAGGVTRWHAMGQTMKHVGISLAPTMWGFLAASAESVGIVLMIIGVFFRPSCLAVSLTVTVVAAAEYFGSHSLAHSGHEIELALFLFTLLFVGPGRFSVDKG